MNNFTVFGMRMMSERERNGSHIAEELAQVTSPNNGRIYKKGEIIQAIVLDIEKENERSRRHRRTSECA